MKLWTPSRSLIPFRRKQLGLLSPFGCGFQQTIANFNTPTSVRGTSIVPGINDALGSFTEIISAASLTSDAYGIWLCLLSSSSSAQARPILCDIGADPNGGTAWSNIIPNLNAACAQSFGTGPSGHFYYFPLYIRAGTSLAARARVGNATANTLRVMCRLFCKPTRPEVLRCGSYVDSIGADTANSRGTVITPGVSSAEGAYTSLGALPRPAWWFQAGYSIDDSTMNTADINLDLAYGGGATKIELITDMTFVATGTEQVAGELYMMPSCYRDLAAGETLFARASISIATADSNNSVVAHALGG